MAPETVLRDARDFIAQGDLPSALALLQAARLRCADHAGIALLLADVLQGSGRIREAVAAYTAGLALNDMSADGWYGAGCAHLALSAPASAAACFSRASALAPNAGPVWHNLGKSLFALGRIESAVSAFERAAALGDAAAKLARESLACIIPGDPRADHEAVLRARRSWAEQVAPAAVPPMARPAAGRKLRVAYLSAFFGAANWMKPVFALINRHDRSAFDVFMLSDGELPSAASGYRDHDLDTIGDLRGVNNERAAHIIAGLGIDILVDLNGYSFQGRLPLLMHRPAPVIVGWFNMFSTTGIAAYDWLVGDDRVIRSVEEPFYSERIHRLPGTYLAFEVRYQVPDVAPPPCIVTGQPITFGSLGSQYKLTDAVLGAWAQILLGAPGTRLFLKNATLDDVSVRDDLMSRLVGRGIAAERVTLQGRSPHFDFLDAYRHVDIALDTFPYNGGTTTTEALWQGVPVLTFDGDRWASRTSASLLHAAGLADWVLADLRGTIDRAILLGSDPATPAMLATLRQGMRNRLLASAACDADGLCRAMESFYRAVSR
jgi:predicted O-linked N-acetylglucosamine transferase (SPINDLY family)